MQLLIPLHLLNKVMKNISGLKYIILGLNLMLITNLWGQDWTAGDNITLQINEFCLIETNHAPITLTLNTTIVGAAVESVSNSDLFVRMSSLVPGGTNREITARISSGSVPTGTFLSLVSADCTTTNSGGNLGNAVLTPIILSAIDQDLIIGISSGYTGTGYNDGYQMTFTWGPDSPTNYSQLASDTYNITVIFTITAHDGN